MAISIDECYSLLKYRMNKSGYLSNISPNDFNLLFPKAEINWFNSQYKDYGITKKINDTISRVKTDPLTIAIDGAGKYTFPADMLHESSVTHVFNGVQQEVTEFQDDHLANKLSSSYDAPNEEFPIYLRYSTYLQFYPITLGNAILTYLKQPPTSKWAYTLVSNRPVYDAVNSVQPIWSLTDINKIIYLVMQDCGINVRDQEAELFGQNQFKIQS